MKCRGGDGQSGKARGRARGGIAGGEATLRRASCLWLLGGVLLFFGFWSPLAASAGGASPASRYPAYEAIVAQDGPAAQYRLQDEVGSASLADSAGGLPATNQGASLGQAGPFTGALAGSFAAGAYASLPSNPLGTATAFTAEAWIDATGIGVGQQVFDLGSAGGDYLALSPASRLTGHPLLFEMRHGATYFRLTAPRLLTGTWKYVAVTEDPLGDVTMYVDGVVVAHGGATFAPADLAAASNNWLGKSQLTTEPAFSGLLSNVAFYTKSLTAAQILAHYAAARAPLDTTAPSISGIAQDGRSLSAAHGTWSGAMPVAFAYQWQSCNTTGSGCTALSNATGSTYTLTSGDVGTTVRAVVTATNGAGSSTATTNATTVVAAAAPADSSPPAISGKEQDGQTLTASAGTWSGTPQIDYSYQWQSCDNTGNNCTNLPAATGPTYTLSSTDVGTTAVVQVSATNAAGTTTTASNPTATITAIPPASTTPPSISGIPQTGQTLTADPGTWSGSPPLRYSYQWQSCDRTGDHCWNIGGATGASYQIPAWELGAQVQVAVTATNAGSAATGVAQTPGAVVSAGAPPATTYFPSSFWVTPIASGAAPDPQSAQMSNELTNMAYGVAPSMNYNCRRSTYLPSTSWNSAEQQFCHQVNPHAGIDTTSFAPPVYTVGADQPRVSVILPNNHDLQAAMQSVPIPADAHPAPGSDGQLIIWQPSSDTMWELWQSSQDSSGQWHASWGGRITNVSTDPGHYRNIPNTKQLCSSDPAVKNCEATNWGGPSARVPNLPGLITLDQLQSGQIDHAIAIGLPDDLPGAWSWPAQATDGPGNSIIPQGARIRIDPSVDLDAWFASLKNPDGTPRQIAPIERMIAQAMQTYGAVVVNTSGSVTFYAQNWAPSGNDPFNGAGGLFGGMKPYMFMVDLPWENTQVLKTNMCNAIQSGLGLYQTSCHPAQYVTANPNPPAGHPCSPPLAVSPQPGQTSGPTLTITSPTWTTIGAVLKFAAYATDPSGVTHVDFRVDGQVRYISNYPHCELNRMQYTMGGPHGFWDAESEPWGDHTLQVDAYDSLGNESSVSATVHNGP